MARYWPGDWCVTRRIRSATVLPRREESKSMSDAILYWNNVALEANRQSHTINNNEQTGPPLSARALAIVHLAMYDACMGAIEAAGNPLPYPHYLGADLPAPANAGASLDTAVAAAAYFTLKRL